MLHIPFFVDKVATSYFILLLFYTVNTPPTGFVNKPVIAHLDNLDLPKPFIRATSSSFHYKIALVDSTDKDLAVVWRPWSVSSSREP